jgi:hypothetical protein
MGLTFLTGYVLGQHGAQSAKLASLSSSRSAAGLSEILEIEARIDRLVLVIDAMWSLLEDSGYTDEQLRQRIEELDAADGSADGRHTPQAAECTNCGARVAPGLPACQFCGTQVPGNADDPLRGV